MRKNNKGITLISLIVTVIVLLILASVAAFSGIDLIKTARLSTFTTEMKIMQTQVNGLYEKSKNDGIVKSAGKEYKGEEIKNIGKDLPEEANEVFTEEASGITNKDGYRFFDDEIINDLGIDEVKGNFYVNVEERTVVSYAGEEYEGKVYYTLDQLPSELYNVNYNDKNIGKPIFKAKSEGIGNGKWQITIYDIEYDGYIEKWDVKYQPEEQTYWNTSEDLSFIVEGEEEDKFFVSIYNGTVESDAKEVMLGINIEKTPDEDKGISGGGTEENPFLIQSIEDLVTLSNNVNAGNSYANQIFRLELDLSFKAEESYIQYDRIDFGDVNGDGVVEGLMTELTTGAGFPSIGNSYDTPFGGSINGNYNVLADLYINNDKAREQYKGLIGGVRGDYVKIENLKLLSVNIKASGYVGGIVGRSHAVTTEIINSIVSGNIEGGAYLGGIIGNVESYDSSIETKFIFNKNINKAKITSSSISGGLVGEIYKIQEIILSNNVNKGKITGNSYQNGGVVGYIYESIVTYCNSNVNEAEIEGGKGGIIGAIFGNDTSLIVKECYNLGNIINEKGGAYIAGIVGDVQIERLEIYDSYNLGNIKNEKGSYIGGIAGRSGYYTTIKRCYNKGDIQADAYQIGGILSMAYLFTSNSEIIVEECYNTGNIIATEGRVVGGIVGQGSTVLSVSKCYNTGNIIAKSSIGGIVGFEAKVFNSYNTGNITGDNQIGGIVGYGVKNLINCYNTGTVTGITAMIGGIAGEVNGDLGIENNYNFGNVSFKDGIVGRDIGSIVGYNSSDFTLYKNNAYLAGTNEKGISNHDDEETKVFKVDSIQELYALVKQNLKVENGWVQREGNPLPVLSITE